MRAAVLFVHDIRFQLRHGFYGAYLFICAAYLIILHTVPSGWAALLTLVFVFTDTGVLGAVFSGGIVQLERNQGVHRWLAVSPAGSDTYLGAKTASLTLLSLAASIVLLAGSPAPLKTLTLPIIGILAGSAEFTCLGLMVGIRSRSILGFFAASIPFGIPAMLPLLALPFPAAIPFLPLLPNGGVFLLLRTAFVPLSAWMIAVSLVSAALWSAAAAEMCRRLYGNYIREGGGEVV